MKLIIALGLFIFFTINSFSQENKYIFDFDYAQFGYDSSSNYVEFYYSFNQNELNHFETDSGTYVEGILRVVIFDSLKAENLIENEWKVIHKMDQDTSLLGKSLVGVVGFVIPTGIYNCEIGGRDVHDSANQKTYKERILIDPLIEQNFSLSDIQLASKILQDSENSNSIFYKNTYEVVPMPTSVFGENQPVIFYYCELYSLNQDEAPSVLKMNSIIYNSRGQLVSNKIKEINRNVDSRVEVGTIVINKYPTDTYTLVLTLIDSVESYGVSSSKRFFIYNPDVEPLDDQIAGNTSVLSTQFGVMSEEEIQDLFDKSKYIASSAELDQYKKISSLDAKREWLFNFWKVRDQDPSTPRNDFYIEYLNRANASNQKFGTLSKVGWKTDRGRIYMTYGEPSEIERFPNQIDSKPYEIWYYNEIEGGVVFVFADLSGFSDYMLLHSTIRGEIRDDNWMRRISSF
jgi:GWxTD domain-containing protein